MRRRKIRKFAENKQRTDRQSENSKTEATLILCGSSGERANNSYLGGLGGGHGHVG